MDPQKNNKKSFLFWNSCIIFFSENVGSQFCTILKIRIIWDFFLFYTTLKYLKITKIRIEGCRIKFHELKTILQNWASFHNLFGLSRVAFFDNFRCTILKTLLFFKRFLNDFEICQKKTSYHILH